DDVLAALVLAAELTVAAVDGGDRGVDVGAVLAREAHGDVEAGPRDLARDHLVAVLPLLGGRAHEGLVGAHLGDGEEEPRAQNEDEKCLTHDAARWLGRVERGSGGSGRWRLP